MLLCVCGRGMISWDTAVSIELNSDYHIYHPLSHVVILLVLEYLYGAYHLYIWENGIHIDPPAFFFFHSPEFSSSRSLQVSHTKSISSSGSYDRLLPHVSNMGSYRHVQKTWDRPSTSSNSDAGSSHSSTADTQTSSTSTDENTRVASSDSPTNTGMADRRIVSVTSAASARYQ